MLTDEQLHPLQIERYRQMTADEKFSVLWSMIEMGRSLVRARIERENPADTPAQIERKVAAHILHGYAD